MNSTVKINSVDISKETKTSIELIGSAHQSWWCFHYIRVWSMEFTRKLIISMFEMMSGTMGENLHWFCAKSSWLWSEKCCLLICYEIVWKKFGQSCSTQRMEECPTQSYKRVQKPSARYLHKYSGANCNWVVSINWLSRSSSSKDQDYFTLLRLPRNSFISNTEARQLR